MPRARENLPGVFRAINRLRIRGCKSANEPVELTHDGMGLQRWVLTLVCSWTASDACASKKRRFTVSPTAKGRRSGSGTIPATKREDSLRVEA